MLLKAIGLRKTFSAKGRKVEALKGINLELPPGKIIGLIGPNGAGKSTLIKLSLGYLIPTAGTISLLGEPPGSLRALARIGYLPEHSSFPLDLKGEELLRYVGELYGKKGRRLRAQVGELLEQVGLKEAGGRRIGSYSKGMMQRLGLAQALIGDPELLILDEPMTGLDPVGRREVKELLRALHGQGVSIFFSSHILEDIEHLCEELVVIIRGEIRYSGSLAELLYTGSATSTVTLRTSGALPELPGVSFRRIGENLFVGEEMGEEAQQKLMALLMERKDLALVEWRRTYRTLEERFVELLRPGGEP